MTSLKHCISTDFEIISGYFTSIDYENNSYVKYYSGPSIVLFALRMTVTQEYCMFYLHKIK